MDESKPEKAFPPCAKVEILGIDYDLKRWTWNMDNRRWSVLGGDEGGRVLSGYT